MLRKDPNLSKMYTYLKKKGKLIQNNNEWYRAFICSEPHSDDFLTKPLPNVRFLNENLNNLINELW
jgi:hypothetical protein